MFRQSSHFDGLLLPFQVRHNFGRKFHVRRKAVIIMIKNTSPTAFHSVGVAMRYPKVNECYRDLSPTTALFPACRLPEI
jgi:hypothetical protein